MLSTLLVALSAAAASAAPISLIPSSVSLPNATQYNATVVWYEMNGRAGACGKFNKDSDLVVGLPLEFYSKLNEVSPYCGEYVVVQNTVTKKNVTALVADASTLNNTLSVSVGTWEALNGTATDLTQVNWRRANETEIAAAKKAQSDAPSTWAAPSSTSTSIVAAAPTHAAAKESKAPASSSAVSSSASSWSASKESSAPAYTPSSSSSAQESSWTPSSSPKAAKQPAPSSSSSSEVEKTWSSSSSSTWTPEPKTTSTSTWSPEPTPTTTSQWTPTTTAQAQPKETQQSYSSGSYSGQATWYTQDGTAGSCGNYNSDYANIVALSYSQVNGGSHCGQGVKITNTNTGATVYATVADTCPGCGYGSLDLSLGAFDALGSRDAGVLPITWSFA
ncbi:RlpA-like double-psi beta-barrel domain-containing protein [Sporobolomyces koalae]|uniref:RlpA-like double-psi beta-barrel domain-containing protein n=1 Tax=Sporobolomyces koalae TaxID=500713 RepID=UPI00318106ED